MQHSYNSLLRIIFALFIVCGITLSAQGAVPIDSRGYIQNDLLVSVDWTKKNFQKKNVLLLDARDNMSYIVKHIKGALSTPWQMFSNMKAAKGKGFTTLLSADKLTKEFQKLGISDKKTIVVYANPTGWGEDGRIAWMLRMAGLSNVKILDGGWPAWEKAGGETARMGETSTPSNIVIKKLDDDMLATTEFIVKNRKNIVIIDTRTQKEWDGATDYGESRGGHIAGALHLEWSSFFNEDKTVKTQAQIETIMNKLGVKKSDIIIPYCTAGIRSAHMTLILRMAGYKNAKNYAASLYEWSARKSLPMQK